MQVEMSAVWKMAALHWACPGAIACLTGAVWLLRQQVRIQVAARRRDRRVRGEIEAYARLDLRLLADGDVRALSRMVCRVVAEKSRFYRAAMLVRDADGRLYVAGSTGMDDKTAHAIQQWGERADKEEQCGSAAAEYMDHIGAKSFAVVLGESASGVGAERAIVIPIDTTGGRMVGALVVCVDGMIFLPRKEVVDAMAPLEALVVKLGRAMENAALAERLLRAEKLAGLGLLAGGVAHALNNPLTAVMGFAELIADTTQDSRVEKDARTIVQEAQRMRETVESLLNFWRPGSQSDEMVRMTAVVEDLASACRETLEKRGVRLVVQVGDDVPAIRGNREKLRQVMEHLLNNAAQAIASSPNDDAGFEHAIRVTVSHDARGLHVIVSDTGPGFRQPGRAFDPFYTTRQPGEGTGLGLSICYGIVREHGGEISAFNLHPRGAAVVLELPVADFFVEDFAGAGQVVA
ncbi:phospho-acceptor domain-containing protein [Edaphobacter aggregans]|uniref:histidine kinase n=1 Tax=Edaphobacter aggregans TaxID=570835 RepID=A0A3R9R4E2_9BACT|nr:HAMP domain-containing sensor histidine kinase [Edaphobacter aggregans]RSL17657.1 phospho-acceptor domain-containing protein [Edaphobacter aggregans]